MVDLATRLGSIRVRPGSLVGSSVVEGLLAAGKHMLCEKPLCDTLEDARAMADAARIATTVAKVGFTFRRTRASPTSGS